MTDIWSPKFLAAIESLKSLPEGSNINEEFAKAMINLGWRERINNLYRIKDKLSGNFLLFRPNIDQDKFLDERTGHDQILKSRQIGFTTLMCVYNYDRALWDGWQTGIMSHLKERTDKIFEIVKNVNEWFRKDWGHLFKIEEESNNANKISWKGSIGSISVSFDFQSLTMNSLHVSEAAFIEERRISNSLQSVPENGEVTLESTANGRGGFFYDQWTSWKRNGAIAPYRGHFFPWYGHYPEDSEKWEKISESAKMTLSEREQELLKLYELEGKHIAWRRWKISESYNGDEEKFEIDYPADDVSCFLSGENRFFSASLMRYQESFVKDPSFVGDMEVEDRHIVFRDTKKGFWNIWEMPKVDATYVMGVDTSEGIGKDSGVISVWNRNTGEQVAMLKAQLHPDQLASQAWMAGQFFKLAWICPESNTVGHTLIQELVRKNYGKIYKRRTIDEFTQKPTMKLGFQTNVNTKVPLTDNFMVALREGRWRVRSDELLNEMSTFVQVGSKNGRTLRREAIAGCHDDTIIAACLAYEMNRVLGNTLDMSEKWMEEENQNVKFDEDTGFIVPSGEIDISEQW